MKLNRRKLRALIKEVVSEGVPGFLKSNASLEDGIPYDYRIFLQKKGLDYDISDVSYYDGSLITRKLLGIEEKAATYSSPGLGVVIKCESNSEAIQLQRLIDSEQKKSSRFSNYLRSEARKNLVLIYITALYAG